MAVHAFSSNAYAIVEKQDMQTGKVEFYLSKADPIPHEIAAITGDVIQNLRSSLDHLVAQLFLVNNLGAAVPSRIQFPTDSSATQYKANAIGKIQGLRQDAIDAINGIEPYDGGNGADFSVLNRLNRIDKHRLLITINSAVYENLHVTPFFREMTLKAFPDWPADFKFPDVFFNAAEPSIYGLKVGDKLPRPAKVEAGQKLQFSFGISFNEPGVLERKPLVVTLQHFTDLVGNTVAQFKPCLA
jgi:hypothetical protein